MNNVLNCEHKYENPIEIAEIIVISIDNIERFEIIMWISLDKGVYIHVTEDNANSLIKYLYERYPY